MPCGTLRLRNTRQMISATRKQVGVHLSLVCAGADCCVCQSARLQLEPAAQHHHSEDHLHLSGSTYTVSVRQRRFLTHVPASDVHISKQ